MGMHIWNILEKCLAAINFLDKKCYTMENISMKELIQVF